MSTLRYGVVVLPKLDCEEEIRRLREEYDPWYEQAAPYVTIVPQFTPATLDEIESLNDYISLARRDFHPFALGLGECVEKEDRLLFSLGQGKDELGELRRNLHGAVTLSMLPEMSEPMLVLARVPDQGKRELAKCELARFAHSIGLVDSLCLIEAMGDEMKLVANYPFGIGRVDFYDSLRA